jgi:hypothetical protein
MAHTVHPVRRRRRGRPLTYDPASNEPWKTTARFSPENAVKIIRLRNVDDVELPVDELIDCLTGLLPVNPSDPPLTSQRIMEALRKLATRFDPGVGTGPDHDQGEYQVAI